MVFFYFIGNPFYIKPVNFNFNYLDHLCLTIFIRRQQRETLSSCMLHFDSNNASHLVLLLLLSGQIRTNPGPIEGNCDVCENKIGKNGKTINCEKFKFLCHFQCIGFSENYYILINQSVFSWICYICGSSNLDTSISGSGLFKLSN